MLPAATVSLQMNSRRTKAIPARANGISSNMYRLEHCMHLELPRARLRPGLHWPHWSPDLLFAHCKSVPLRENVIQSPRMQCQLSSRCSSTPCSSQPSCRCLGGPSSAGTWTGPPTLPRTLILTASHWKVW